MLKNLYNVNPYQLDDGREPSFLFVHALFLLIIMKTIEKIATGEPI